MRLNTERQGWFWAYLFLLPNFIGFFVLSALPILMGFAYSLTDYDGFNQFNFLGLKNFFEMLADEYFQISLRNNIVYTLVTVPATIVIAFSLAVVINGKIPWRSYFRTVFFFPTITSLVAVGIVWSVLFNPESGPINSVLRAVGISSPPRWLASTKSALFSIMIVSIWKSAGYYMIIILAGLQGIPNSLYESADLDGASRYRKLCSITLPLLSPTMFFVLIVSIINSFQVFDLVSVMTNGGPGRSTNVLVYRIYQEGFVFLRQGYASAIAYFLFFMILVVTIIQFAGQKRWVNYLQ